MSTELRRSQDVNTILYLSDNSPEGLSESLSIFTQASKVCLLRTILSFRNNCSSSS